jgi:hypothetical protein
MSRPLRTSAECHRGFWSIRTRDTDRSPAPWPAGQRRGFSSNGAKLFVQNQEPLEVASVDEDTFVAERVAAERVAAEIDFERDANGKVVSLTLKQKGTCLARRATLSTSGGHKRRVPAPDDNLMIFRPQRNL